MVQLHSTASVTELIFCAIRSRCENCTFRAWKSFSMLLYNKITAMKANDQPLLRNDWPENFACL